MKLTLDLRIPPLARPVRYQDGILLTGSCFTEHMSDQLGRHRFRVCSNPNGILFNPLSVADSLQGYLDGRQYGPDELFLLNELWNSWDHHTRFSHIHREAALAGINAAQAEASAFIRQAGWVVITLGSAFQYYLKDSGRPVANNHRAPGQWFEKRLLDISLITDRLAAVLDRLFEANPSVQVLFTISPVRHIRDGVVDNNRSKARLLEAVHSLCERFEKAHYFPAYEIVIDILRDYRYYDIDFVHPNYLATQYVWECFAESCIDPEALPLMEQVRSITTARSHRPRFPETEAHRQFLQAQAEKTRQLMTQAPYLDLREELAFFEG